MVMNDNTVKERENIWEHVANKIIDVLHLLIQATNIEQIPLIQVPIESKPDDPMNDMQSASRLILMGSNTLNYVIKAYTQCHSAEKKNSQIY
jgi:hypothetical protein